MPQRSPFAIQELLGLSDSVVAAAVAARNNNTNIIGNSSNVISNGGEANGSTSSTKEPNSPSCASSSSAPTTTSAATAAAAAVAAATAVSAVTPSLYPNIGQTPFTADQHHQMTMAAASRMAYFNAHAAVAAAFLPHNMSNAGGGVVNGVSGGGDNGASLTSASGVSGHHHHLLHSQGGGKSFAYCKICAVDLKTAMGLKSLERHADTEKHKKASKTIVSTPSITQMDNFKVSLKRKVAVAEIRLSVFIAEHNLAFNVMEHLPSLLKIICCDSEIAKQVQCSRTKSTAIIKYVTGAQNFEDLCLLMRANKFSVIIDESTDLSSHKNLCAVVRLCKDYKISDFFYNLFALDKADAKTIYDILVKSFTDNNIDYKKNLIGFGADGAAVMMGNNLSVRTFLQKDIPNLFVMKCICHSFHLCASYACSRLPASIEDLCRDVYNYIQNSPKRICAFKRFQNLMEIKPNKILHFSQTRWLSRLEVVNCILMQFDALKAYFTDAVKTEHLLSSQTILNMLNDPIHYMFLSFLSFVLPFFNNLNKCMQSEKPKIQNMYNEVSTALKSLLSCYIKKSYLDSTNIKNVDYANPRNQLSYENMYYGVKVSSFLETFSIDKTTLQNFQCHCLSFLIEGCKQIYNRFNFNNQVFRDMEILDPLNALNKNCSSIFPLVKHFPNLIPENSFQDIDNEWRMFHNSHIDIKDTETLNDIEEFWRYVSAIKHADGTATYPLLTKFVFEILSLPHSSANSERIFSKITLLKTKIRNRLETETLIGLLHTNELVKNHNCFNFKVEKPLLDKYFSKVFNQRNIT